MSNTFHIRHVSSQNITFEKGITVKCYTPYFIECSKRSSAHSITNAYEAAVKLEIKCIKIKQCCRPYYRLYSFQIFI